jgi:ferredoxin-type protein NapG
MTNSGIQTEDLAIEAIDEELPHRGPHGYGLSRRGLVVGSVGVLAMLAFGGFTRAFASNEVLLRPPGGQDANNLLGACIKCDRCRSVCPRGVIDVAHLEDGLLNARSPKMNFRKGYCDYCKDVGYYRCVVSCPTRALLSDFDPAVGKIGMAVVSEDECLLYRSGKCSKQCIPACTYDALSINESGLLIVDEALCNGCGACELVCPSASYINYTGTGMRGINIEIWKSGLS